MKIKARQIFFASLLLSLSFCARGQEKRPRSNQCISLKYGRGYIYAHSQPVRYVTKGYPTMAEFNWGMRTTGRRRWHSVYKRPVLGLAYSYRELANPLVLGEAHAFSPYLLFYLVETKPFALRLKTALGVSLLSRSFDIDKNIHNVVIGSHVNAYIHLNFDMDIRLAPGISALLGGGVAHYSNGNMKPPNRGINIFELQGGLRYVFQKHPTPAPAMNYPEFKASNELSFQYVGGIKKVRPVKNKTYYASILTFNLDRRINPAHRFGGGISIFSDRTIHDPFFFSVENYPKDYYAAGSHLSYSLVFNQFALNLQMGVFFYKTHKYKDWVYQRYCITYRFWKNWMALAGIKTYWGVADFMFVGLGYRVPL